MNEETRKALLFVLNAQVINMQVDDMQGASFHVQKIKRLSNQLQTELDKFLDGIIKDSEMSEREYWRECSNNIYKFINSLEVKTE